ncbi:MAG TPA: NIPSNAP family protein [Paracoccaceae bacterium]|nr:NIPSNAP family protein [Paracoccaceae bacterium]
MLLDVRTYRCKPGMLSQHLKLYDELGKAAQYRHLGEPLCYITTEIGDPNEFIHIWKYESVADREAKRAKLWTDPEWIEYLRRSDELGALEAQSNRLMRPAGFCPLANRDG